MKFNMAGERIAALVGFFIYESGLSRLVVFASGGGEEGRTYPALERVHVEDL